MSTDISDQLSLALALSLQEADLEYLLSRSKGKNREDSPPSDAEAALLLYAEDLRMANQAIQDRILAESIARAEETDFPAILEVLRQEVELERDREEAARFAEDDEDIAAVREMGGEALKGIVDTLEKIEKLVESRGATIEREKDGKDTNNKDLKEESEVIAIDSDSDDDAEGSEGEGEDDVNGNGKGKGKGKAREEQTPEIRDRRNSNKRKHDDDSSDKASSLKKAADSESVLNRLIKTAKEVSVMNENNIIVNSLRATSEGPAVSRSILGLLKNSFNKIYDDDEPVPGSSKPYRHPLNQVEKTCSSCLLGYKSEHIRTAPCNHDYCGLCMLTMFENASKDEESFPPKCCGREIQLDTILMDMDDAQADLYLKKQEEFSTSVKERLYCAFCSEFIISHSWSGDLAFCSSCFQGTCVMCKGKEHENEDCPDDENTTLTLQTAKDKGWKRCPECSAMVDRTDGCRHMTCRCKAEWCYVCLKKWKTCKCPLAVAEELMP